MASGKNIMDQYTDLFLENEKDLEDSAPTPTPQQCCDNPNMAQMDPTTQMCQNCGAQSTKLKFEDQPEEWAMIDLYSTCIVIFNYTLDLGIFQRCYGQGVVIEYNVNDTADVSINDPLPTQDTGSVVAGDALHPGDQSEDDEQEHSVSLESEVESDINQGSETNDIVVNNQEDITPTPAPRRSKRTTSQPNWMKSGEFIMAQQSNWLAKAEFLKGLAMSGMFPSAEKDIGRALVKIVTENT
ncbi:unnamed protein product [Mytilus coruscus]|uniref:Uncharacterized protein n=1 Tax=Mytilus coruscus TaxID=42192 RepID=A0A6J8E5R4_MYTCO|nr:unnamed protein product [Mytilus coruscus]